jgi:uncharacterized membrane protein HdeD (DUF308 family)
VAVTRFRTGFDHPRSSFIQRRNQMSYEAATYNTTPRWLSIVLGVLSIIVGVLLLRNPGTTLLALAIVLGIYFIIVGIVSIIGVFTGGRSNKWWKLIGGILAIIAGVMLLGNQVIGAAALGTAFNLTVGVLAIIAGVTLLVDGFRGGGCLSIILGVLSTVLGFVFVLNPWSGLPILPLILGWLAILVGVVTIVGAILRPKAP